MTRHDLCVALLLMATLLVTAACYWPSLSGPFLFDDIPILKTMGMDGGLNTPANFIRFVDGREAGPLGRPISMLSFTLHDLYWPTDPRPFRLTNLMLHLLCGLLVFVFSRQLFLLRLNARSSAALALTVVALWLLHPLLTSTAAYIIQRMTQLASLFMLLGLICYLKGRIMLLTRPAQGWAWILGGMILAGTLALFSKEIGLLLPFYALVIELVMFSGQPSARRKWLIGLLLLPVLAVLAYLVLGLLNGQDVLDNRNFTRTERLYTQALVLGKYLQLIIIPQLSGLGLIHDDFPIARGFLDPPLTLVCMMLIGGLLVFAAYLRRTAPFVSLGILWFFAGHSLEAGPVSLELYFEHRNYLPLLGIVIAAVGSWPHCSDRLRRIVPIAAVLFLIMAALATWQTSRLWGNERWLMQVTAAEHPHSMRAQTYLVNEHLMKGEREQAIATLEAMTRQFPDNATTAINLVFLKCHSKQLVEADIKRTETRLAMARYDNALPEAIRKLIPLARRNACEILQLDDIHRFIDILLQNPRANRRSDMRGALHFYKAAAFQQANKMGRALQELEASYAAQPLHKIREHQIIWLLQYGRVDDAQHYLDLAREHDEPLPWARKANASRLEYLQSEIDRIRKLVELRKQSPSNGHPLEKN